MKKRLWIGAALLLLGAVAVQAAPDRIDASASTRITADRMVYSEEKQRVIFENNVMVERPDMKLRAGRLTVYLKPKKMPDGSEGVIPGGMENAEIDRIVAEQNVRMEHGDRRGTCSVATYVPSRELLTMEGNPVLTDGESTLSGKIVRYYAAERRSEVVGDGKKRVEAVFTGSGSHSFGRRQ
ncbi:MAG: LptA/OstA family protein [Desulfovibrionaceae bacterium]|nr:LptA/OstA family protein [Desulfovibrionaceae bacterium]